MRIHCISILPKEVYMGALAYYNGVITDYADARISLSDRSVFFGDGVYDVMLAGRVKIYQLDLHLQRLKRNASRIGIDYPQEIEAVIKKMVRLSDLECCAVYVQLSRSSAERIHAPDSDAPTNVLVTIGETSIHPTSKEIEAITFEDIRYKMCDVKSLNLLPSVLASIEAKKRGCDEAIFVRDGIVTEGAKSNLFAVKDGILHTHPTGRHILPGITRQNVIRLAKAAGIEVCEACFGDEELFSADEVFITSTTKLLRKVAKIDGKAVGSGRFEVSSILELLLYNEANSSIR